MLRVGEDEARGAPTLLTLCATRDHKAAKARARLHSRGGRSRNLRVTTFFDGLGSTGRRSACRNAV